MKMLWKGQERRGKLGKLAEVSEEKTDKGWEG